GLRLGLDERTIDCVLGDERDLQLVGAVVAILSCLAPFAAGFDPWMRPPVAECSRAPSASGCRPSRSACETKSPQSERLTSGKRNRRGRYAPAVTPHTALHCAEG